MTVFGYYTYVADDTSDPTQIFEDALKSNMLETLAEEDELDSQELIDRYHEFYSLKEIFNAAQCLIDCGFVSFRSLIN